MKNIYVKNGHRKPRKGFEMATDNRPDERKTIALPAEMVDWIEEQAKENHLTFSAQLRMILARGRNAYRANA